MIRIEGETLTVRLESEAGDVELTGQMLPCPAPTCPCKTVFLSLIPTDRPQERVSCAIDVGRRVAVPMQVIGGGGEESTRTARKIIALLRDEHWNALKRLLREGKANGTAGTERTGGAGAVTVVVAGELPRGRNAPCPCGSGKKSKRCSCGRGNAMPPFWVSGG